MTALANMRSQKPEKWRFIEFTLAQGNKAWQGGAACLDRTSATSTKVVPGSASPNLIRIGIFAETVDATSVAKSVTVDLEREVEAQWWVNGTNADAVLATDICRDCYMMDDQTVSITPTGGRSLAGRIWAVDSVKGVLVEKYNTPVGLALQPATAAFTANDWAPSAIIHGAVYDVPTTGAASTITLPAAAPDGTVAYFTADGTKNSSTVQYRDGTGPVNLTTALTAAKRHLVVVTKRNGLWFANAYVGP